MKRPILVLLLVCCGACGCLDTGPRVKKQTSPTPIVDSRALSDKLAASLKQERQEIAAVASKIAEKLESDNPPSPSDQESMWAQTDDIRTKYGPANGKMIEAAFQATKTPQDAAKVWREIAKGYYVQ